MKRQGSRCKGDGRGARHARRLCLRAFRARAGARAWTQRGWQRHRMLWWRAHWAMERTRRLHAELAWCGRMLACYAGPDARMRVVLHCLLPALQSAVCASLCQRTSLPAALDVGPKGCGGVARARGMDGGMGLGTNGSLGGTNGSLGCRNGSLGCRQQTVASLACTPACPVGVCVSLRGPRRLDGGVLSGADGRRVVCVLCAVAMYTR